MGLAKLTPPHTTAKDDEKDNKSLDRAPFSENGSAGLLGETSHLTLEALRAEVEADISTSGQDSAYDRKWQSLFPHIAYLGYPRSADTSLSENESVQFDSNLRNRR